MRIRETAMPPLLRLSGLAPALLVGVLAGCGDGAAPLTPVEGVLKLNGKATGNVLIQLEPVAGAEGRKDRTASAISDTSGRFRLVCGDGRPGAPVGKYKVTLADNALSTEEEPGEKGAPKTPANRIPTKFLSAVSTPLELLVEEGKKEYELSVSSR